MRPSASASRGAIVHARMPARTNMKKETLRPRGLSCLRSLIAKRLHRVELCRSRGGVETRYKTENQSDQNGARHQPPWYCQNPFRCDSQTAKVNVGADID